MILFRHTTRTTQAHEAARQPDAIKALQNLDRTFASDPQLVAKAHHANKTLLSHGFSNHIRHPNHGGVWIEQILHQLRERRSTSLLLEQ